MRSRHACRGSHWRYAMALRSRPAATADASSYAPIPLRACRYASTLARFCLRVRTRSRRSMRLPCAAAAPKRSPPSRPGGRLAAGADAMRTRRCAAPATGLRGLDTIIMSAAGIAAVTVRQTRLHVVCGGERKRPLVDAARTMLERLVWLPEASFWMGSLARCSLGGRESRSDHRIAAPAVGATTQA